MIPILFEYNETVFTSHGIGDLIDAIECISSQNDEGEWELAMSYPISGELFNELTIGRLIYAKVNTWQGNQIFRIYGYEKPLNGIATIKAQHCSYDLRDIPVKAFKSAANANCNTVLANMKSNAVAITGLNISKFTFSSNVSGTAQTQDGYYELTQPSNARSVLLDGDDSIKGCFGGDLVINNYTVSLQTTGGADRGVMIEYGVDLIDLKQEENISEMTTGVLPYYRYTDTNDDEQITYGSVQYKSGTYRNHRVEPLDLTEYYPNQAEHTSPTVAQLNSKAQEWISKSTIGEPEVNFTLSYATLGQDVRLFDAVTVRFVKMGIDVKSKVTAFKYDVLNDRPKEIQVGKTKKSVLFSLEDASRLKKGLLPPARIKDKSITSDKYADNSVTSSAIGTGSVGTSKIAGGAVTSGKIGGGAVTESKVADGAITNGKVADNSINASQKIQQLSITAETLASNCVTNTKIKDGEVYSGKIADGAVITVKIGDAAVANVKLYQGARDAIAAVWEIDSIVSNTIQANGIHAAGYYVGSTLFQPRTINYKTYGDVSASMTVLGAY